MVPAVLAEKSVGTGELMMGVATVGFWVQMVATGFCKNVVGKLGTNACFS